MPTALELKREGWKPYLDATRERSGSTISLTPEEERARTQLLGRVREAAELLKERFGVRRVVLLGSLAHRAWFVPQSDVDLAVEGLDSAEYWRAWRAVEQVIEDRAVDLIEMETAGESLLQAVQRYGVEL